MKFLTLFYFFVSLIYIVTGVRQFAEPSVYGQPQPTDNNGEHWFIQNYFNYNLSIFKCNLQVRELVAIMVAILHIAVQTVQEALIVVQMDPSVPIVVQMDQTEWVVPDFETKCSNNKNQKRSNYHCINNNRL